MILVELLACTSNFKFIFYKIIKLKSLFSDRHGEPWRDFRSKVQKPILQLSTVRKYLEPLETITGDFLQRCECLLDENSELPDDFDNEIHKWALECKNLNFLYFIYFIIVIFV